MKRTSFLFFLCYFSVLISSSNAYLVDDTLVNNWAVIVGTSRGWFNYRHISNALSIYRSIRRLGFPDDRIILMLADDVACNARNSYPSQVFNDGNHNQNLYGNDVQVDYKGEEVTVENIMRLITGRHYAHVPKSKRLLTDEHSNVLIYLTGHGGNQFLKFRDVEEIQSHDFAQAVHEAYIQKRFKSALIMTDTCQATTLHSELHSPNVIAIGSSEKGESSYSYYTDLKVGVSVIDRFTYFTFHFLQRMNSHSNKSVLSLFSSYDPVALMSHHGYRSDLFSLPLDQVPITEFFGSKMSIQILQTSNYWINGGDKKKYEPSRSIFSHKKNAKHFNSQKMSIATDHFPNEDEEYERRLLGVDSFEKSKYEKKNDYDFKAFSLLDLTHSDSKNLENKHRVTLCFLVFVLVLVVISNDKCSKF